MREYDPTSQTNAGQSSDERQDEYLAAVLEAMARCCGPALGLPWLPVTPVRRPPSGAERY